MIETDDIPRLLEEERQRFETESRARAHLQHEILAELRDRLAVDMQTKPTRFGNWWYFVRRASESHHGALLRFPVLDSDNWSVPDIDDARYASSAELIIDDDEEARNLEYYARSHTDISADGKVAAFAIDTTGDELHDIHVVQLGSERTLIDHIANVYPQFVMHPSGKIVYYLTLDETHRPDTLWEHRIGALRVDDRKLLVEDDKRFWLTISPTRSGHYLRIFANANHSSECTVIDLQRNRVEPRVIMQRKDQVRYFADHFPADDNDWFVTLISRDGGEFRLALIAVDDLGVDEPTAFDVHMDGRPVSLTEIAPFDGYLAFGVRDNGASGVGVIRSNDMADAIRRGIPVSITRLTPVEPPSTVYLGDNPSWDNPVLRINGTSFLTPLTVFGYNERISGFSVLQAHQHPRQPDTRRFEERKLLAESDDGTLIPISLVAPKDRPATGVPFVAYAYGAYGVPSDPTYSPTIWSLLERGIGFAIIHVRGGGEYGVRWHNAGKSLLKPNSFLDYEAGVRALVESGYADPRRIVGQGNSAGGLLVAAVGHRHPELLCGILTAAPFVDPLTTLLDPTLPLTVSDWGEFGNPTDSREVHDLIRSYSPLECEAGPTHPPVFALAGVEDTRVSPLETLRWVEHLRAQGTSALILPTSAGHEGESGEQAIRTLAHQYAWVVELVHAPQSTKPSPSSPFRVGVR